MLRPKIPRSKSHDGKRKVQSKLKHEMQIPSNSEMLKFLNHLTSKVIQFAESLTKIIYLEVRLATTVLFGVTSSLL